MNEFDSKQTDKTVTAADKVAITAIGVAIAFGIVSWMQYQEAESLRAELSRPKAKITQTIECGGQ